MLHIRHFIAGVNKQERTPKGEAMHGSNVASLFDTNRSLYLITIPAKAPSSRHPAVVIPPEKKEHMPDKKGIYSHVGLVLRSWTQSPLALYIIQILFSYIAIILTTLKMHSTPPRRSGYVANTIVHAKTNMRMAHWDVS